MFDVGDRDLPVPTSGNWVIKCWVIKYIACETIRTFFFYFFTFFQNQKTWLLTFFWVVSHAFLNTAFTVIADDRVVVGLNDARQPCSYVYSQAITIRCGYVINPRIPVSAPASWRPSPRPPSCIGANRKRRRSIGRPRKPHPRTKHEVNRMTRCWDMAIWSFQNGRRPPSWIWSDRKWRRRHDDVELSFRSRRITDRVGDPLTDDVTWPWKVKTVTQIQRWPLTSCNKIKSGRIRSGHGPRQYHTAARWTGLSRCRHRSLKALIHVQHDETVLWLQGFYDNLTTACRMNKTD